VAAAFIGPWPDGRETNHIDGVKGHNVVENLEYVTHLQNQGHAARIGLYRSVEGEMNPAAKLSEDDVREIRALLRTWTATEVAQSFGVCEQTIYNIAANRTWSSIEGISRIV